MLGFSPIAARPISALLEVAAVIQLPDPATGIEQLAVDQQPLGGTVYPFAGDEGDLPQIIGDLSLSYRDDGGVFLLPFRLAWFFNAFGVLASNNPDFPSPSHNFDLVIQDAMGRTVFDSTVAANEDYFENDWGTAWKVAQWTTAVGVCRLAVMTRPLASSASVWTLEQGWLDTRTVDREPPRLRSLTVGTHTFDQDTLELSAGYNMLLGRVQDLVPGGRRTEQISLSAIPGAGLGRYPGCNDLPLEVRTINQIAPDSGGRFLIQTDACFRLLAAQVITNDDPRQASVSDGQLQLFNDCQPCCSCDDYVNTYKASSRIWDRLKAAHHQWLLTREQYNNDVTRWNAQKACREAKPLRLSIFSSCPCEMQVGYLLCNTSGKCLTDLELRLTFQGLVDGIVQPSGGNPMAAQFCESTIRRLGGVTESYRLGGTWPVFRAFFDAVDPGGVAMILTRWEVPNCEMTQSMKVTTSAHTLAVFPGAHTAVETSVHDLWVAAGLPTEPPVQCVIDQIVPLVPPNDSDQCDCPE